MSNLLKIKMKTQGWSIAQVEQHLHSECKLLNSNPSITKKEKKKQAKYPCILPSPT
jgi:hypothetical protein